MEEKKNVVTEGVTKEEEKVRLYPELIERVINNLKILSPDLKEETLLGMVLSSLSYALCTMRVQFKENLKSEPRYPNLFTAFYLHSNMGKDTTSKLIKTTLLSGLKEFQEDNEKNYQSSLEFIIRKKLEDEFPDWDEEKTKQEVKKRINKERRFSIGSNSAGTPEGLYAEFEGYKRRKTGCIFVEQSEAGAFAESKSERKQDFLNCLLAGYDNRVEGRNLKDVSYPTVEDVPMVAEFLSAPDVVKKNKNFREKQIMGLGRRIWIFMQEDWKKSLRIPTDAEIKVAKRNLFDIGEELFSEYFNRVMATNRHPASHELTIDDSCRHLTINFAEGVYDKCYRPYKIKNIEECNNTEDTLIRSFISEYPYRACKVACIYSILNHPTDFKIYKEDFEQAVRTVESSNGMKTLVGYKPPERDKYDYIVEVLLNRLEEEKAKEIKFSKTELGKIFETALKGIIPRDERRALLREDRYEETKDIIKGILQNKGYDLVNATGGTTFSGLLLKKCEPTPEVPTEDTTEAVF